MRMQVTFLLVAAAACVLGDKGEVIARTVSVKSPERRSSVISHFTPADHRYEATGSVLIAPESAEASRPVQRTYGPPAVTQQVQPAVPSGPARPASKASGAALTRTVKVKTPVRVPTVISHFVPADHRYDAEGSVTIVKGSAASTRGSAAGSGAAAQFVSLPAPPRKVKVERKLSASSQGSSSSAAAAAAAAASAAKLALTRTVSVKSPERVPTVISHFVPAEHRYEATGSVTIVKGSQNSGSGSAGGQAQFVSRPAPAPKPRRPAPVPALKLDSQFSGASSSASNLALTRTVSVKSPERVPTVISHFVPAEHRYEATGSVTIVKGSQNAARGGSLSGSSASQATFVKPAAPAPAPAPAPVQFKVKKISRPAQTFSSAASSAANLALTRTVSVKSPERIPTVISHFVPAEHRYEATGSVTIAKGSQGATRRVSGASGSAAGAQVSFRPAAIPLPVASLASPKPRVEAVRKASSGSEANLALTRTVSVKSRDRQPTVISHFVPAEHQYEATGSVTIVKGSSGGRQSSGFSQASSSSGRRVSGGSSSFGATGGSSFSTFGQASGSAAGASGSQAAFGQRQGGSFGASASGSSSGSSGSFSASSQSSRKQESLSASRKAASSGQSASGRVSFGASQAASAGAFGQASGSASQAASAGAFGQASGRASQAGSVSASQKASASSSRAESSSARRQSAAAASTSQSSGYGTSASAQRSQASAAAAAAAAAARGSSSESYTYRLAEPYRGGSSVSAAELLAELKAFREESARSGVKISQTRQSGRDDDGSGTDPYNFSIRVQDSSSTNYQSRDEWVGDDGVTYGWYTMLMPDGFFYNYTYTSHPVKGYQVKVTKEDSGIALKPVEADIFAPATVFSDKGIGRFADFAISGVNNDYQEPNTMNYEENAAAMFAESLAEAMNVQQSSSTRAAVSSGPASHICGHRIVRERGSKTPGSRTLEGLVYGPCTYTEEAAIRVTEERRGSSGSGSRGSFGASGSASGFSAQGSSSGFASKASGSSSGASSSSGSASFGSSAAFAGKASGSASRSSSSSGSASSGSSAAFASKASGSASQSVSQISGSSFGAASKAADAAFVSASQSSGSAFGSASKASGSTFGSASQSSGSASASKASGSAFGSSSRGSGSASASKVSGSAFGSASRGSGSASASKVSGSTSGSASRKVSSGSSGAGSSFFQSLGSSGSLSSSGSSGAQFFGSAGASRSGSSEESGSGRYSSGFTFQTSSSPSSSEEKSGESSSKFQSSSSSFSSGFSSSSRSGGGGSGGSLTRTVSVKSPVRHSSVISHFVPADHVYDASAGVTLGSSSVRQSSTPSRAVFVSAKSGESAAAARKAAEAALAAASRSAASRASNLALTRTVAVKSPERHTNVISHFVPAEHRYEAVGSVTIRRDSEQSTASVSPVRTFTVKSSPAPAPAKAPVRAPAPAPARGYGTPSRSASPSNLSLTRTVSVKSPERKSSVISHFTPAEHKYEATGSVTINQSSA